jgi:hypothetical protein
MEGSSLPVGLAFAAALAACATVQRPAWGDGDLLVHVENDIAPPTPLWVSLVSADGAEQTLGGTPPTSAKIWRVRRGTTTARYRLLARMQDSTTITSHPFVLRPSEVVRWDLASNQVRTSRWVNGHDPLRELMAPVPSAIAGARITRVVPAAWTDSSAARASRRPLGR